MREDTQRRTWGSILILLSIVCIAIWNIKDWTGAGTFYLSFGWGLAMLL